MTSKQKTVTSQTTTDKGEGFEGLLRHSKSHQLSKAEIAKSTASGLEADAGGTALVPSTLPTFSAPELLAVRSSHVARKH